MTDHDLDEVYTRLCRSIDAAGAGNHESYLARLALLLIGEIDDRARVEQAIDAARGEDTPKFDS